MKRILSLLLILVLCLGLAACAGTSAPPDAPQRPVPTDTTLHKIGVIVYNTGDEEVIGFREYLQCYIEDNFPMVEFLYSDSIQNEEEELSFIQSACDQGVEGFMSFLSRDLRAEVALCEQNRAYYLLASGTVSDEDFDAVADNPWFLGMFGPGQPFEFQAGADMARYFLREQTGSRWFILSGGASLGNEMHYQRTMGILDTLATAYGVNFPQSRQELAQTAEPLTLELDKLTVTICPGYISREADLTAAMEAYAAGTYDVVLSVLPPADMVSVIGKTPLGVVDRGLSVGSLLGGTSVVEVIFSYPGLGNLAVNAITSADYFLVQGYVLWVSVIYMVINLLVDISYNYVDPRMRLRR